MGIRDLHPSFVVWVLLMVQSGNETNDSLLAPAFQLQNAKDIDLTFA